MGRPRGCNCVCRSVDPPPPALPQLGYTFSGSGVEQTIRRFDFSSETWSIAGSTSVVRSACRAVGNPSVSIYAAGGSDGTTRTSSTDKFDLQTETTSTPASAALSVARDQQGPISERSTKGYWIAGATAPSTSTAVADKIDFATDTTAATPSADAPAATTARAGINASAAGYCNRSTSIDKTTFATDSTAAISATLSGSRTNPAGSSDIANVGYFTGGIQPGAPSPTLRRDNQRLDFATETRTLGTELNTARTVHVAFGNTVFSYFCGGTNLSGTPITSGERIDYATETMINLVATQDVKNCGSTSDGGM